MKRFLSFGFFGLGVVILAGCPIYPDRTDNAYCDGRYCYRCPDNSYSSDCTDWGCATSNDCPSGYACNGYGACVSGGPVDASVPEGTPCAVPSDCIAGYTCGSDNTCHAGDCASNGCPSGFQCTLSGGTLSCVGQPVADGGKDSGKDTGVDAGHVDCHTDSECADSGAGALCLDGTCVSPANQCTDGTQCAAGSQCVQGACTPSCGASTPCPTGYACSGKGVCTVNPTPCGTAPDATTCTGGTTCAQDHCVTPCGSDGTCANGLVCVEGGCVPNQKPNFTCAAEGTQDACATGSICLHHSCYIACDPDAGSDACKSADKFNVCKSVATSGGSYAVCGSSTNLGTDCDPTQGKACSGALLCIDGFCR